MVIPKVDIVDCVVFIVVVIVLVIVVVSVLFGGLRWRFAIVAVAEIVSEVGFNICEPLRRSWRRAEEWGGGRVGRWGSGGAGERSDDVKIGFRGLNIASRDASPPRARRSWKGRGLRTSSETLSLQR